MLGECQGELGGGLERQLLVLQGHAGAARLIRAFTICLSPARSFHARLAYRSQLDAARSPLFLLPRLSSCFDAPENPRGTLSHPQEYAQSHCCTSDPSSSDLRPARALSFQAASVSSRVLQVSRADDRGNRVPRSLQQALSRASEVVGRTKRDVRAVLKCVRGCRGCRTCGSCVACSRIDYWSLLCTG